MRSFSGNFQARRNDEAAALLREALAINRQVLGERTDEVSSNLGNLALIVRDQGDFDEAERLLRQALQIDKALYGPEHFNVGYDLNGYIPGASLAKQGAAAQQWASVLPAQLSTMLVVGISCPTSSLTGRSLGDSPLSTAYTSYITCPTG
jgi:tetratricopeptide (TPR) repeat protein